MRDMTEEKTEMDTLIDAQLELSGRIGRTIENLKKAGSAKITRSLVSTTLGLLDDKWRKFEERHESLQRDYGEELRKHKYSQQDYLSKVEEMYARQRASLLDVEESFTKSSSAADPPIAEAASGTARTTLPKIQLPQFSGDYEDWPSFRHLFQSLIGKATAISDVEKLHYLKVSLKGQAELLVKNLTTKGENYQRAWTTLVEYFENKRILVRSCLSKFAAL